MVLDGGPVTGGQPSTVLRVAGAEAEILRPGPITAEHLARIPGLHLRST
jgi:tRNA A37 threonylcarbamoyladenosine synthetase subunit TsaC/SUA5/YrdC